MTEENSKKPKLTLKLPQGGIRRDLVNEYISLNNKSGSSSIKGVIVEVKNDSGLIQKHNNDGDEKLTHQEKIQRVGALRKSLEIEKEVIQSESDQFDVEEKVLNNDIIDDGEEASNQPESTKTEHDDQVSQDVSIEKNVMDSKLTNLTTNATKQKEPTVNNDINSKNKPTNIKKNEDQNKNKKKYDSPPPLRSSNENNFRQKINRPRLHKNDSYTNVDPIVVLTDENLDHDFSPHLFRQKTRRSNKSAKKNYSSKINVNVVIDEKVITLRKLSERLSIAQDRLLKFLNTGDGKRLNYDDIINRDLIELIGVEFGYNITFKDKVLYEEIIDHENDLQERPPIVTIMGHVDHGKTTLLDKIRSTRVAEKESGGITQHIGAYQITTTSGKKITFIDTPGHEAFTAMRMRGAKITDIVILVVAADDGVNAQTIEAINHTIAAGVVMIVAVNKIDKSDADVTKALTSLIQHGILVEELGGDIISVPISAKNGTNIDKLEDAILLQAEMLNLKANFNRSAQGGVLEVSVDKRRGLLVTLLVQKGTLKLGDVLVCGNSYCKVRSMEDYAGNIIKSALPSTPVVIMGFDLPPVVGETFVVVENEKLARSIATERMTDESRIMNNLPTAVIDIFENEDKKFLNLIIKADVNGSLEAILDSIAKLEDELIKIRIIHSGIGSITRSDILLAEASSGVIFAFRVKADLESSKVKVLHCSVIYDLMQKVKELMINLNGPIFIEELLGAAEIRQIFDIDKLGKVAGCLVKKGIIKIGNPVRLMRDNKVIYETSLKMIKHYKDTVKEIKAGMDCGLFLEDHSDIKEGDIIESIERKEV